MGIIKYKYFLFLLILFNLFACSSNKLQDSQNEPPECIFSILKEIDELLEDRKEHLVFRDIQYLNTQFDTLSRHQIYLRPTLQFDELLDNFDEFQGLDTFLTPKYFNIDDMSYFYIYSRFKFHFIVELQKRLEGKYYRMPSMERLSYSARFIVANEDFSLLKTHILNSIIDMIAYSKTNDSKKQAWFSIFLMLKQIDLNRLTPGTQFERRSYYGLKATKKEILTSLESVAENEPVQDIRQYAFHIIKEITNTKLHIKPPDKTEILFSVSNLDSFPLNDSFQSTVLFDSAYHFEDNQNKITYYDRVLVLNPNYPAAYFNRGIAYFEMGQFVKAIKDFTKVIRLKSSEYRTFLYRGICYLNSSFYSEAISDFTEFIKKETSSNQAYAKRGQCYQKMKNYKQAISDYNLALALKPDDAVTLNNRGICYRCQKDYLNAIKDHLKALEIDPNYTTSYYNLGCNYWQLNDMPSVIQVWEKCLEIDPNFSLVKENLPQARKLAKWQKRKVKIYRKIEIK